MSRRRKRDMTGTARCLDCGVAAVHERGPGSPLVIHHVAGCSNGPAPKGAKPVMVIYDEVATVTADDFESFSTAIGLGMTRSDELAEPGVDMSKPDDHGIIPAWWRA